MRNPYRIPILLDIFSRDSVKETYLKDVVGLVSNVEVKKFKTKWEMSYEKLEKFWIENPDLRLSQVLIGVGVLPNLSGSWFYKEDEVFLNTSGIADKRATTIWNKKDGDLPIKGIPLKNISDKDLNEFLDLVGDSAPPYLVTEKEYREDNDIYVKEESNPYYTLDID